MSARKRHIRRPDLPWRPSTRTVCGRPARSGLVVSLPDLKAIPREERFALKSEFCQVCRDMLRGWPEWDADPVGRMYRECELFGGGRKPIAMELRCIAELIANHRAEFDELLEGEQALAALAGF